MAPLTAAVLMGLTQARQSGLVVYCAFVVVSFVLAGLAMVISLTLFLLVVGLRG